jgi:hypothetical protein
MEAKLEHKDFNQAAYESAIVPVLKDKSAGATIADVVVATGLKTEWVDYSLRQLLDKYPAHLEINDRHELVYIFDFTPKSKSLQETLLAAAEWTLRMLWQGFMFSFKIWIVLMLFTYMLFNIVVLVVAITAITRDGSLLEAAFKGLASVFKDLPSMFSKKTAESDRQMLNGIFSYVFGQTVVKDERATEKIILQHIQANQGKLLPTDIIQLTGWTLREAQTQAAQLLANYNGEPSVTDEGVIVYEFPDLVKDNAEIPVPAKIWERPIPAAKMNDNDKETNSAIRAVNGFNMVMALVTPFLLQWFWFEEETMSDTLIFFITLIPLAFSFIFFFIPLLRMPFVYFQNSKIKQKNKAYFTLREIFKRLPNPLKPKEEAKTVASTIENCTESEAQALLERLSLALDGTPNAAEAGTYFTFESINQELKAPYPPKGEFSSPLERG